MGTATDPASPPQTPAQAKQPHTQSSEQTASHGRFTLPDLEQYKDIPGFYTILADMTELGKGVPVIATRDTHGMRELIKPAGLGVRSLHKSGFTGMG